jgi:hypothetical protein
MPCPLDPLHRAAHITQLLLVDAFSIHSNAPRTKSLSS